MVENVPEDGYYSADEEIEEFSIIDEKLMIDKYNDNIKLYKHSFRDIITYSESWPHNRKIDDNKVNELYQALIEDNGSKIPWILHGIYDKKLDINKVYILDGQHKIKSIKKYIEENDIEMKCNKKIWIWIYTIDNSTSINSNISLDLFKKINNNRIFEEDEIPDTFVIDIIKEMKEHSILKVGLSENKCYTPKLHIHLLNEKLLHHKEEFRHLSVKDIVKNIVTINHKISMKTYNEIYGKNQKHRTKYNKANKIKFYLNLTDSYRTIDVWIKYIAKVEELI
jgi:hypothetical protein